jgi:hypothetical protein
MIKVKTFVAELRIFKTMRELDELDEKVNRFIEENDVKDVISVSDTVTHSDGSAMGIIRVVTYEA